MLQRVYEKVFKESKLFINYMNILPKKGVVGRTNASDVFIWKYICLHQMVKIPNVTQEKQWREKLNVQSMGNGGMPARMETEIKDIYNF